MQGYDIIITPVTCVTLATRSARDTCFPQRCFVLFHLALDPWAALTLEKITYQRVVTHPVLCTCLC